MVLRDGNTLVHKKATTMMIMMSMMKKAKRREEKQTLIKAALKCLTATQRTLYGNHLDSPVVVAAVVQGCHGRREPGSYDGDVDKGSLGQGFHDGQHCRDLWGGVVAEVVDRGGWSGVGGGHVEVQDAARYGGFLGRGEQ